MWLQISFMGSVNIFASETTEFCYFNLKVSDHDFTWSYIIMWLCEVLTTREVE